MTISTDSIASSPSSGLGLGDDLAVLRKGTVWRAVLAAAERFPDRDVLVGASEAGIIRRLTYQNLARRVRNFSAGLAHIGVRRGDRVVLWMTNSLEWVVASLAIQRIGAAVVPVNTFLKAPEIKYLIEQAGARHILMIDRFRTLDLPAMFSTIVPEFAAAETPGFLYSADMPDLRNVVVRRQGGADQAGAFDFDALEAFGETSPDVQALARAMESAVQPSDLAMVKYTSGSTGFPKGVMLEQGGLFANGVLHSRRTGANPSDVIFSMMPFFHAGGSVWGLTTAIVNGGTLVFTEAFDPELAVSLIRRERATIMFGVLAEEVARCAIERGVDFPTLRIAPIPDENTRRVMPNVTYTIVPYGLTETYGPAAVSSPDDPPESFGCCGRPLDGNEIRVVDPETGSDLPPGVVGEAWVRGNTMRGYWNKPVETAKALTPDGWLRSEDLVSRDGEGRISYVGRLKLMLKVGGENVSIEEVERVVACHEAIASCGVVGISDPRKGEAVGLYVTRRAGAVLNEGDLRHWLESRLARFKMPREIAFIEELPWLANGKLDRVALSRRAMQEYPA